MSVEEILCRRCHPHPDRTELCDFCKRSEDCGWTFPEDTTTSVDVAARLFASLPWLSSLNEDTGGAGLCQDVSEYFCTYLRSCGIKGAHVRFLNVIGWADWSTYLKPEPRYVEKAVPDFDHAGHYVVVYEGKVYDFTARQFNEDLPYPFIWDVL